MFSVLLIKHDNDDFKKSCYLKKTKKQKKNNKYIPPVYYVNPNNICIYYTSTFIQHILSLLCLLISRFIITFSFLHMTMKTFLFTQTLNNVIPKLSHPSRALCTLLLHKQPPSQQMKYFSLFIFVFKLY
eukprot:UN00705